MVTSTRRISSFHSMIARIWYYSIWTMFPRIFIFSTWVSCCLLRVRLLVKKVSLPTLRKYCNTSKTYATGYVRVTLATRWMWTGNYFANNVYQELIYKLFVFECAQRLHGRLTTLHECRNTLMTMKVENMHFMMFFAYPTHTGFFKLHLVNVTVFFRSCIYF